MRQLSEASYFNIGSDWSFSFTLVYGTPKTRSMMWTNPLVAAMFGSITVALTPPPSTVNVTLWPFLITLKYSFLRSAAVCTWNRCASDTTQLKGPNTTLGKHNVLALKLWSTLYFKCMMLRNWFYIYQCFLVLRFLKMVRIKTKTFCILRKYATS